MGADGDAAGEVVDVSSLTHSTELPRCRAPARETERGIDLASTPGLVERSPEFSEVSEPRTAVRSYGARCVKQLKILTAVVAVEAHETRWNKADWGVRCVVLFLVDYVFACAGVHGGVRPIAPRYAERGAQWTFDSLVDEDAAKGSRRASDVARQSNTGDRLCG